MSGECMIMGIYRSVPGGWMILGMRMGVWWFHDAGDIYSSVLVLDETCVMFTFGLPRHT